MPMMQEIHRDCFEEEALGPAREGMAVGF
jgi:hypothetical protein